MNVETKLLNRLKESQSAFALESLKRPQTRDSFEYGYRVGMVAGYEAAINVLLSIVDEEKKGDKDL